MKKTWSALLALVLAVSLFMPIFTVGVAADDLPTFSIAADSATVHPKQTVTISVNLKNASDFCPYGIATIQAAIRYDADKVTVSESDIAANSAITKANMDVRTFLNPRGETNLIEFWAIPKMTESIPRSLANVFTVTFTVKENVPEGTELVFTLGEPDLFVINAWSEDKTDSTEIETLLGTSSVKVKVGKLLSEDATLSSLSVEGFDLNRDFNADRTTYAIAVPYETTSLKVNYTTSDSFAKVKLSGNTKLAVGTNTVKIAVTAENGVAKKTYSITVTRQPAQEEESSTPPDTSSETSSDVSSDTTSETSSDVPSDVSSDVSSDTPSEEPSSEPTSQDDEYIEAMQKQIDDLRTENTGLRDKETAVVIIFSVISALLLAALIIVSINYKKDVK